MSSLITPAQIEMKQDAERKVMDVFKVDKEVFMSKRRTGECADARFAAWCILRFEKNLPYKVIARLYNKHHTTVTEGIASASRRLLPQMMGINLCVKPSTKKRGKRVYIL